jgi:hypothetical protein
MGGFREKFSVDLWLSPVKSSYPPITPTISPEKVRFKGKMATPLLDVRAKRQLFITFFLNLNRLGVGFAPRHVNRYVACGEL